jgi:hypothetical protein
MFFFFIVNAQMAKSVDALVSGTSDLLVVQVRVLFWAQKQFEFEYRARVVGHFLRFSHLELTLKTLIAQVVKLVDTPG